MSQHLQNSKGLSLPIVLIGLAMASGSIFSIMSLLNQSHRVQLEARQSTEVTNLDLRIKAFLASRLHCRETMTFNPKQASAGTQITELRFNATTPTQIAVGNSFAGVEIVSMEFVAPINTLDSFTRELTLRTIFRKDSLEVPRYTTIVAKIDSFNDITACVARNSEAGLSETMCRLSGGESDPNYVCRYTSSGNSVTTDFNTVITNMGVINADLSNQELVRVCRLNKERLADATPCP